MQVCLSRALRMVMPTIALLVSVRLSWHFLVVGVWVLLSPVHAFSLAIPTKVACVAIAIEPESPDRGIELLRERLGKAIDKAYFQSCQSNLRCWSKYVFGVCFGIKVTFRFAADADCAVVATCLKHVLGSIGFWQEESWQQKMNMEMQDGTNMDKHPKFRFAILYLGFWW